MKNGSRRIGPLAFLWLSGVALLLARDAAADGVLSGTILSHADGPLAGVTVSAAATDSALAVSVYTDAEGRYVFPPMPEGSYRVWAQALGFEYAHAAVDLDAVSSQDFTLQPLIDFETRVRQLPGDLVLQAMPHASEEDRRLLDVFADNCTSCHTPSYTLQHRFTEEGWAAIVRMMEYITITGFHQAFALGDPVAPDPSISFYRDQLAAYLTRVRGPDSEAVLDIVLPPRPSGEAADVVWRAYPVPIDPIVAAGLPVNYSRIDGRDWTDGSPYGIGQPGVQPLDAVHDDDGNVWFTINSPNEIGTLGRVDASSGAIHYVRLSHTEDDLAAASHGIARAPDGLIWFDVLIDNGNLASIDPQTGRVRSYPTELGRSRFTVSTVRVAPDGHVWINVGGGGAGALRLNPQTLVYSHFPSVTTETFERQASLSYGMTIDADGNGWWVMFGLDLVQNGQVQTQTTVEVALPDALTAREASTQAEQDYYDSLSHFGLFFYPWSVGARHLAADPNGRVVWVANSADASITRIDIDTRETSLVPVPGMFRPLDIQVTSTGDVWLSSNVADHLLRYEPASGTWTRFDLPERGTEVRRFSIFEGADGLRIAAVGYRTRTLYEMWLPAE